MGRSNLARETKFSGANGDRENIIFPVQLTKIKQDWKSYPVQPYSAESADHTFCTDSGCVRREF